MLQETLKLRFWIIAQASFDIKGHPRTDETEIVAFLLIPEYPCLEPGGITG